MFHVKHCRLGKQGTESPARPTLTAGPRAFVQVADPIRDHPSTLCPGLACRLSTPLSQLALHASRETWAARRKAAFVKPCIERT